VSQVAEPPVSNASHMIILAQGGRLDLLRVQAERVYLPRMVEHEVLQRGMPDAAVAALRSQPWLIVVDPDPIPDAVSRLRLDAGEAAVLTWALAHPGTVAIIDDRRGRRAARRLGIPVIGILGLIVDAKLRGAIPAARPVVVHLLHTTDWYLSRELQEQVLARIGE
jgi:predicted nucleic acid-binding protein